MNFSRMRALGLTFCGPATLLATLTRCDEVDGVATHLGRDRLINRLAALGVRVCGCERVRWIVLS